MDLDRLAKAIERVGDKASSAQRSNKKSDLTEGQQADKLLEVCANFNNPPKFKAGDFVRYRSDMALMVRNARALHVVLEVIPEPYVMGVTDDNHTDPTSYRKYDLFVAVCDVNDKEGVHKYAADSRDLEMWPDGDRLKRQGTA